MSTPTLKPTRLVSTECRAQTQPTRAVHEQSADSPDLQLPLAADKLAVLPRAYVLHSREGYRYGTMRDRIGLIALVSVRASGQERRVAETARGSTAVHTHPAALLLEIVCAFAVLRARLPKALIPVS